MKCLWKDMLVSTYCLLSLLLTFESIVLGLYLLKSYNMLEQPSKLFHKSLHKKNVQDEPKLFIAVITGINFHERRQAVRNSWMKDCSPKTRTKCMFFTDGLNIYGKPLSNDIILRLRKESEDNGNDLVVLNTPSGRNFAIRLLAVLDWVKDNAEFDFFLRIDDDHFLCLDRLVRELPYRPREKLYWGYLHCVPGVVRIDEGWLMLTADVVHTFLRDKSGLQCSKFADQAVAMWIYDLMKTTTIVWFEDRRIFHDPPASTINEFKLRNEICHTYLSLHGSYPIEMRSFRKIHEREKQIHGQVYKIPPVIDTCPYRRDTFKWQWFDPTHYTQPIPCKDNPIWSHGSEHYIGREYNITTSYREVA